MCAVSDMILFTVHSTLLIVQYLQFRPFHKNDQTQKSFQCHGAKNAYWTYS